MEGSKVNIGIVGGSGVVKTKRRRTLSRKVLITLLVLAIIGAAYAIFMFFKPLYVIGDVSISRKDVKAYQLGLDEYKKQQPQVDFGKDHYRTATDDLVLNAAFKLEIKKSKDTGLDKILEHARKEKRSGSAQSQRMQLVRAENATYQRYLQSKILATRDLLTVSIPFDAPVYDGKNPDQVRALRQESIDILSNKFMPLINNEAPRQRIAAAADVNAMDDDTTDDKDYRQYYDGLVSAVDQQIGEVRGIVEYNDIDQDEYYGVKVDNLKNTADAISKLTRAGQHTGVFASRTGNYMIVRLEKIYGGEYTGWEDFLNQYKKKYAKSKLLAYDITPTNAINYVGNQAVLLLTTPGLQQAAAASCSNSHNVTFGIVSFDDTANAPIPNGTTIIQSRRAHDCGSAYEGDRVSSDFLGDNCMGPEPSWRVSAYADSSKYVFTTFTTSDKTGTYYGWPKWVASRINGAKTILITFRYVQRSGDGGPRKASSLDVANCDLIGGWIFDSSVAGGVGNPVNVHVYFDGPVAVGAGYDAGPANSIRDDVEAHYPGVGNNHGFAFDPTTAPLPIDIRDGNPHTAYFYAANATGNYEFARATIAACGPRPPQAPIITVDADTDCNYFNFIARDTDNQTANFNYEVHISNNGAPKVFSFNNVTGWQSINPWAPDGISLTDPQGVHWWVKATEVGGGNMDVATGDRLSDCPFNEASIDIVPSAPVLLPDREEPTSVDFSAQFVPSQPINSATTECTYFIRPRVGADISLGSGEVKTQYLSAPYTCAASITLPISLTAGDAVCAYYKASPGKARTSLIDDTLLNVLVPFVEKKPPETCTIVVNRPFVSFYGNDVYAGGGYANVPGQSCNTMSHIRAFSKDGFKGSGVQFAASALNTISGFNSARLRSGSVNPLPPSGLTFANQGGNGSNGVGSHCFYDYYAGKDKDTLPRILPSNSVTSITGEKWQHSGTLTIGSSGPVEVPAGAAASIYVDGDVIIKDNIKFASSSWSGIDQISSFYLIVKGNIYIEPSVTQLDGMYIMQPNSTPATSGKMYTCYNAAETTTHRFPAASRYDSCTNQLTINGGLQAVKVYFDRVTSNSMRHANGDEIKADTSKAAEVINFSPELYLAVPQLPRESENGGADAENLQVLPPVL